jgi:hypothetical protein
MYFKDPFVYATSPKLPSPIALFYWKIGCNYITKYIAPPIKTEAKNIVKDSVKQYFLFYPWYVCFQVPPQ